MKDNNINPKRNKRNRKLQVRVCNARSMEEGIRIREKKREFQSRLGIREGVEW